MVYIFSTSDACFRAHTRTPEKYNFQIVNEPMNNFQSRTTFHFIFETSEFVCPFDHTFASFRPFVLHQIIFINCCRRWNFLFPLSQVIKRMIIATPNTHKNERKASITVCLADPIEQRGNWNWIGIFKKELEKTHTFAHSMFVQLVLRKCINVQFKWTSNYPMSFHKRESNLLFNPIYSLCSHFLSSATRITFPMEIEMK